MDLRQTLEAISIAAKTYKNGTQITVGQTAGAYESVCAFLDLIDMAKRKGATPYEIERAFAGELIGSSFEIECTSDEN